MGNYEGAGYPQNAGILVILIDSDCDWCQATTWTNAGIVLTEPLGTKFSEI